MQNVPYTSSESVRKLEMTKFRSEFTLIRTVTDFNASLSASPKKNVFIFIKNKEMF